MLLKQNAYFQGIGHAAARSWMGAKTNKNPVNPKSFQCLENNLEKTDYDGMILL